MIKLLYMAIAMLLVAGCQKSGAGEAGAVGSGEVATSNAPETDSQRIATLTNEMDYLIERYMESPNDSALLGKALAINDSIAALDTTTDGRFHNTLVRSQLMAMSGHVHEAVRLQEQLLSKNPDDGARLMFYANKFWMEGRQDSMRIYAEKAIASFDRVMADSLNVSAEDYDGALQAKMCVYELTDNRQAWKEAANKYARRHPDDPEVQSMNEDQDRTYNARKEDLNSLATEYRNEK